MRILVIGRSGQVARALAHRNLGQFDIRFSGRGDVDLGIPGSVERVVLAESPELVINAAAITAVDEAEVNRDAAFRVNGTAVGEIAHAAAAIGAAMLHISTDYVFDGAKCGPYIESDQARPISVYGASKRTGEIAAVENNPRTIVLRTSWVYSPWGRNFFLTMLGLARNHPRIRVVSDQFGKPTSALEIAAACLSMAPKLVALPPDSPLWGMYHCAGEGACSWADFAKEIFTQSARSQGPVAIVDRIASTEFPAKAKRPMNSVLDCSKLAAAFEIALPRWQCSLSDVFAFSNARPA